MISPRRLFLLFAAFIGFANAWYMTIYYTDGTAERAYGESPGPACRTPSVDKPVDSIFVLDVSYSVWLHLFVDSSCTEFLRSSEEGTTDIQPGEVVRSFKVIAPCMSSASCPPTV